MLSSNLNISISGVPPDNYNVLVFDIGSNGLPVLSNDMDLFVLAAEEGNITVTDPGELKGTNLFAS